jgi:pyruvate/2-oxoglutarate/acetoin dehydrogenase E1 component
MEHAFDYLDAPIARLCAANVPVPMSPPLEDAAIPNEAAIEKAICEALK